MKDALDILLMMALMVCIVAIGLVVTVLGYALVMMLWALIGAGIYFGLRGIAS